MMKQLVIVVFNKPKGGGSIFAGDCFQYGIQFNYSGEAMIKTADKFVITLSF